LKAFRLQLINPDLVVVDAVRTKVMKAFEFTGFDSLLDCLLDSAIGQTGITSDCADGGISAFALIVCVVSNSQEDGLRGPLEAGIPAHQRFNRMAHVCPGAIR